VLVVFPLGYPSILGYGQILNTHFLPHLTIILILPYTNTFVPMFISLLPTIVALYLFTSTAVRASPCVAFDVQWNLLVFGLDGKDWNAGPQNTWANGASRRQPAFLSVLFILSFWVCGPVGTVADITASGRPCVLLSVAHSILFSDHLVLQTF
jgi:hypothetical protein